MSESEVNPEESNLPEVTTPIWPVDLTEWLAEYTAIQAASQEEQARFHREKVKYYQEQKRRSEHRLANPKPPAVAAPQVVASVNPNTPSSDPKSTPTKSTPTKSITHFVDALLQKDLGSKVDKTGSYADGAVDRLVVEILKEFPDKQARAVKSLVFSRRSVLLSGKISG